MRGGEGRGGTGGVEEKRKREEGEEGGIGGRRRGRKEKGGRWKRHEICHSTLQFFLAVPQVVLALHMLPIMTQQLLPLDLHCSSTAIHHILYTMCCIPICTIYHWSSTILNTSTMYCMMLSTIILYKYGHIMLTMGHLLLLLLIDVLLLGELCLVLKRRTVLNHTVNNDLLAEVTK